jgi:hypothetical protein
LVVGEIAPFRRRLEWMHFLHGDIEGSIGQINPKPQPFKNNIQAIVKPFQAWVRS